MGLRRQPLGLQADACAGLLGSEQQREELLPRMASLEWTGAWALTEPSNGSDASALESTAKKVQSCPGVLHLINLHGSL